MFLLLPYSTETLSLRLAQFYGARTELRAKEGTENSATPRYNNLHPDHLTSGLFNQQNSLGVENFIGPLDQLTFLHPTAIV